MTWRRQGVASLEALVGTGVFYGAAAAEAQAMQGEQEFVVGGGNSAGQGDVRHGSIKRVAFAVGEGSAAIRTTHRYLGTE